jgi:hypothetical protein
MGHPTFKTKSLSASDVNKMEPIPQKHQMRHSQYEGKKWRKKRGSYSHIRKSQQVKKATTTLIGKEAKPKSFTRNINRYTEDAKSKQADPRTKTQAMNKQNHLGAKTQETMHMALLQ